MTTQEIILADKILEEASKATAAKRTLLIDQYFGLIRASCARIDAEQDQSGQMPSTATTATGIRNRKTRR